MRPPFVVCLALLFSLTGGQSLAAKPKPSPAISVPPSGYKPAAWKSLQVNQWVSEWRAAYQYAYQIPIATVFTQDEAFVESVRVSLDPTLIPGDELAAVQATKDLIASAWGQAFNVLYGPSPVVPGAPPDPPCVSMRKLLTTLENRLLYLQSNIAFTEMQQTMLRSEIKDITDCKRGLQILKELLPYFDPRPLQDILDSMLSHDFDYASFNDISIQWRQDEIVRIQGLIDATRQKMAEAGC